MKITYWSDLELRYSNVRVALAKNLKISLLYQFSENCQGGFSKKFQESPIAPVVTNQSADSQSYLFY